MPSSACSAPPVTSTLSLHDALPIFTRTLAAFLFVGLGLSLFEAEAIAVLGGGAYAAAIPVIAPVMLASFLQSAASLMDAGFYVRHRDRKSTRLNSSH